MNCGEPTYASGRHRSHCFGTEAPWTYNSYATWLHNESDFNVVPKDVYILVNMPRLEVWSTLLTSQFVAKNIKVDTQSIITQ